MKYQILFPGEKKQNTTNLLSAEFAQGVLLQLQKYIRKHSSREEAFRFLFFFILNISHFSQHKHDAKLL